MLVNQHVTITNTSSERSGFEVVLLIAKTTKGDKQGTINATFRKFAPHILIVVILLYVSTLTPPQKEAACKYMVALISTSKKLSKSAKGNKQAIFIFTSSNFHHTYTEISDLVRWEIIPTNMFFSPKIPLKEVARNLIWVPLHICWHIAILLNQRDTFTNTFSETSGMKVGVLNNTVYFTK